MDYDIDSVTLAMYDFDKTGKFIGWHPYFNLKAPELLEASMKSPQPDGILRYEYQARFGNGFLNLYDYLDSNNRDKTCLFVRDDGKIDLSLENVDQIRNFNELMDWIQRKGLNFYNQDNSSTRQVVRFIINLANKYNTYLDNIKNPNIHDAAVKNFCVANIFSIINNPKNQYEAQYSVDEATRPFKELANESLKATAALKNTQGSFISNIYAIRNNQIGKKGVGIAAVGLKTFFAITQAYNDILRTGDTNLIQKIQKNIKIGNQEYQTIGNLYDYNGSTVKSQNQRDYVLMLSSILSLATDNAKELALAKLNCDTNTMGMWLFGMSLGVPLESMKNIMMSPTAFLISELASNDSFSGYNGGSVSSIISSYNKATKKFNTYQRAILSKISLSEKNNIDSFDMESTQDAISKLSSLRNGLQQQNDIRTVDRLISLFRIKMSLSQNNGIYSKPNPTLMEDLTTLSRGAEQLKILGQILHINQGLYTSDTDTLALLSKVEENITQDVSVPQNIVQPGVSKLHYFLTDQDFRDKCIQSQNSLKQYFNIPLILSRVPHFFNYLKILDMQHNMYMGVSAKYRTLAYLGPIALRQISGPTGRLTKADTTKIYKNIARFTDNFFIQKWLLESGYFDDRGIRIFIPKNKYVYDYNKNYVKIGKNTEIEDPYTGTTLRADDMLSIHLGTASGRASFKRYMEDVIIPDLKKGKYTVQDDNGRIQKITDSDLKNNGFIQRLIPVLYDRAPEGNLLTTYSLKGVNLSPRSDAESDLLDYYISEFDKLQNYEYDGTDLTSLFFLYNAICYQNKTGETALTNIFKNSMNHPLIEDYYNYINQLDQDYFVKTDSTFKIDNMMSQIAVSNPNNDIFIRNTPEGRTVVRNRTPQNPLIPNSEEYSNYYTSVDYGNFEKTYYANPDEDQKQEGLPEYAKSYQTEENGKIVEKPINSIKFITKQGTVLRVEVNRKPIDFLKDKRYNSYASYFTHIKPEVTINRSSGEPMYKYNYKKFIDKLITLLSDIC